MELWLEIFQHVFATTPAYERRYVMNDLSLICRTFRATTYHVVFAEFRCKDTYRGTTAASPDSLFSRRLAFWRSPKIARFVRRCVITSSSSNTLFDMLHAFPQLAELELINVTLDQTHLEIICGLDTLVWLHVSGCSTKALQLAPKNIRCRISCATISVERNSAPLLHPLLLPDYLTELCFFGIDRVLGFRAQHSIPVFHRLKTLRMDGLGLDPEALRRFPAVEHLVLSYGVTAVGATVFIADKYRNSFFPKLKSYVGPYKNLEFFAACAALRQLSVLHEEPSQVIAQPQRPVTAAGKPAISKEFSYPQPNTLQILEASFDLLTGTQAHDFIAQWRNLSEMSLWFRQTAPDKMLEHCTDDFFDDFFPVLPASLERLALRLKCISLHVHTYLQVAMTPAPPTRLDELLHESRCPRLKAVWLEGCDYLLRWRKSLQEPALCFKIHYNSLVAQHKRDDFQDWWKDRC